MTTQSFPISSVGGDPTRNLETADDLSTATPPAGYRNADGDHEFVSKTIRFYFAPADRTRIDRITPSDVHTQWLRIIASTFGNDVKIINNRNKPVVQVDTNATSDKSTSHGHQFTLHQKSFGAHTHGSQKTSFTIVHRILTRVPFGQLKRHPQAFQLLQDHNCYLKDHMWDEHEWDVQQIGFVTGFNPKYYTPERVTTSVRARLCKAMPRSKVPKFQMILKTHKIIIDNRTSTTQAFTIEVPTHSVSQLLPILKEVTKDTKEYAAFHMRKKNPEAFQGAIRYQNHILANQHVVMINYLGTEAMYYLTDRIQAISGVQDVIPTKKVALNGKFYVLVNKNAESKVRESLKKKFDGWYWEVVPDDAKPKDGQFHGKPEVATPKTDGYSSGENSWTTASTQSFLTFSVASMATSTIADVNNLDNAWDNQTAENARSKAPNPAYRSSRKSHTSYAAATISDQMSGITESDPRDARHEELNNKIATLEATVARLCQQVQLLVNGPALQPSTPGQETESLHREKRLDRKDSPRKHKKAQTYYAPSNVEEDINEPAPMDDDRLTVWDDYLTPANND
jgi:hypothetical protein